MALKVFAGLKIRQYGNNWKAEWLKASAAFPGALFQFIAPTYIRQLAIAFNSISKDLASASTYTHRVHIKAHTGTHIYINKNKYFLKSPILHYWSSIKKIEDHIFWDAYLTKALGFYHQLYGIEALCPAED